MDSFHGSIGQEGEHKSKTFKCLISEYIKVCGKYNIASVITAIVVASIIAFIGLNECKTFEKILKICTEKQIVKNSNFKTYWVYGRNFGNGYLDNVFTILKRTGYEYNSNATNWDLLWAHDYPFRELYPILNNLKSHQRINHFPGCGYITNKVDLATSRLKYIPLAFKLPDHKQELLKYAAKNKSIRFVQKNNEHRHIKLKNISDIDLDKANGTFVQEYVERPFLVSGYKFDIGIYTIITSINPLRVYIYNGDALLRFCPVQYYPFDANNIDKYVVGDDYLPIWEVPDLKYYYSKLGFGMKESLNAYIRAKGKNPNVIWEQIEEAIRTVLLNKEAKIINIIKKFKSKHNFFEMIRFDFVIDENLRLYLMEANMSPNLSSAHFPPNKLLFEQVIYNILSVTGIAARISGNTSPRSDSDKSMESANKNIAVYPEECNSNLCRNSCLPTNCQLCKYCLAYEDRIDILQAYSEYLNKADCKRIFPPPVNNLKKFPDDFEDYSQKNQMMYRWYLGKCLMDESWCI